jgi:hypothetical protein
VSYEHIRVLLPHKNSNKIFLLSDELKEDAPLDDEHAIQPGAALRWVINYSEADNIQLCLLSLPQPQSALNGCPAFKRDTCPGLFLYTENLFTKIASTCRPHGAPLPTLFNDNPAELQETLATTPAAFLRVEEGQFFLSILK